MSLGNWPYPRLFAHRGGGSLAPENTLAAMKTGHAQGYAAVEFDVQLSHDGEPMLLHDDTLERTSNGHGRLADRSYTELSQLDAGSWYGTDFRGEPLPRLQDVAIYLQGAGMLANVEIKPPAGMETRCGIEVARACANLWATSAVLPLMSSFSDESLRQAKNAAPYLPRGFLTDRPERGHLELLRELEAVSLHCNHKNIDGDLIAWFHQHGYRVLCYTVNDPARAEELFALGVDGLFTDNLAGMAGLRGNRRADPG